MVRWATLQRGASSTVYDYVVALYAIYTSKDTSLLWCVCWPHPLFMSSFDYLCKTHGIVARVKAKGQCRRSDYYIRVNANRFLYACAQIILARVHVDDVDTMLRHD